MLIPCIKLYDENSFVDSLYEVPDSIAVVGSSGNIVGSKNGSKIDSFSRVVRFSHVKTKGFENDVGSKTTDLVVNCHVYNGYDLKAEEGYSEFRKDFWDMYNDPINVVYVNTNPPNLGRGKVPTRFPFYILSHSGFNQTMHSPYPTGGLPTVGYAFIATLVNFGIKPTLFGFSTPKDTWDHYFEDRPAPSESHDHGKETMLILKMINEGLVELG